jgi:hypothetical protein
MVPIAFVSNWQTCVDLTIAYTGLPHFGRNLIVWPAIYEAKKYFNFTIAEFTFGITGRFDSNLLSKRDQKQAARSFKRPVRATKPISKSIVSVEM